jgi:hypothetical protein
MRRLGLLTVLCVVACTGAPQNGNVKGTARDGTAIDVERVRDLYTLSIKCQAAVQMLTERLRPLIGDRALQNGGAAMPFGETQAFAIVLGKTGPEVRAAVASARDDPEIQSMVAQEVGRQVSSLSSSGPERLDAMCGPLQLRG